MKSFIKKLIIWASHSNMFVLPRKFFSTIAIFVLESKGMVVVPYNDPERRNILNLIRKIKTDVPMLINDNEAYQIFMAVRRTEKIPGDLAEVGVYKGGSAKLIRESNRDKKLHLFDTFNGLPRVEEIDKPLFYEGQFAASLEDVRTSLKGYKHIYFYKGLFPGTTAPVENKKFSFVHLDVDTYESTVSCLQFFYPRMNQGGIIISHDYINAPGVRKAFDEFFIDKVEPIIEMTGSQCLIVKL
jgi:O-methyltransferase